MLNPSILLVATRVTVKRGRRTGRNHIWRGIPMPRRQQGSYAGVRRSSSYAPRRMCQSIASPRQLAGYWPRVANSAAAIRKFFRRLPYLNVWARRAPQPLPVMVWLHGGGYATIGAGVPPYDGRAGEARRDRGTVNYRLYHFPLFRASGAGRRRGGVYS